MAPDPLHYDAFGLARFSLIDIDDVVNRDDVGVIERRSGAGFLDEPGAAVGPRRRTRNQDLDRDKTAQLRIAGFVNQPHSTLTEFLDNLVV